MKMSYKVKYELLKIAVLGTTTISIYTTMFINYFIK